MDASTITVSQRLSAWSARQSRRARLLLQWSRTGQLRVQLRHSWRARRSRLAQPPRPHLPSLIETGEPSDICIRRDARPVVSVIIPTHGKVDYTLRCLASIAASPPHAAVEVIVVDDATPDGSTECLAGIPGIRLIINQRSFGVCAAFFVELNQ
jgi:hypothetical protein